MKGSMRMAILLLAVLGGASIPLMAQTTVFINGLAPDWNQPLDYPDGFDLLGPLAGDATWNAWCAPTAAAGLIGHWEDVKDRDGLADLSPDGNQFIPNGYAGPAWGGGPAWHDYTADGIAGGMGQNPLRGLRPVDDLGWYMDTNGHRTGIPHAGTYHKDVAPGLNSFFAAVGNGGAQPAQNLLATTLGVHPSFGGIPFQVLADMMMIELGVSNRTTIAHFSHWDIILQGAAANPGDGSETEESQFEIEDYKFDDNPDPWGGHGEEWNGDEGEYGLGHAVLVVGYTENMGVVTHLLVHDNSPGTARVVRVPVGSELVAITIAEAFSVEMNDPLAAGGLARFVVTGGSGSTNTWLVRSTVGVGATWVPALNVTIDLANPKTVGKKKKTDGYGYVMWNVTIPAGVAGKQVWLQAVQNSRKTNVITTVIQ